MRNRKAGRFTEHHGLSHTPLHYVWIDMRARCTNPKSAGYANYGARGIRVCPEWDDFTVFHAWAMANGYVPGLAIDRKRNQDGYGPGNCRFVTREVNNRNRRKFSNTTSRYIGVSLDRAKNRWRVRVTCNKRRHDLGLFDDELDAAIARDSYIVARGWTDFTMNDVLP